MSTENEEKKTEVTKTHWVRPLSGGEILLRDALKKSLPLPDIKIQKRFQLEA
jgi:hypothetical protein